MKKKNKNKLLWILQNPVKAYKNMIKNSIIPKPYSHQVKMNIVVKKGQKSGTALIPCTIYAMDHSIDLNPALIRKKDKKLLKFVKAKKGMSFIEDDTIDRYMVKGKKIYYNPNKISVKLNEEEEGKYKFEEITMEEYERCDKCAQKLVLSEVKQTRYRSCPEITVTLGDPAKEDTVVPVSFGVNKSDMFVKPFLSAFVIIGCFWITMGWIKDGFSLGVYTPAWINNVVLFLLLLLIWGWLVPRFVYGSFKLLQWFNNVKKDMRKSKYAYY